MCASNDQHSSNLFTQHYFDIRVVWLLLALYLSYSMWPVINSQNQENTVYILSSYIDKKSDYLCVAANPEIQE